MASTLKHLRSSTADKRPTASGLADGQFAINTASGTPGVFFKDSNGGVMKVGPVHVGATAPNAVPAGSAGNSLGELWVDDSLTTAGLNYYTGSAFVNLTPSGTTTTVGLVELATPAETQTGTDAVRAVTPSGLQSKVSDSTSTTSSTTIASSTAVKSAYDLANAALPKAGGTVTGELLIGNTGSLVFEGSTDDGFETTLAVTDPTADRTITFPNVTGTVVTTGDSGTVTSTMIANDTIVNADINSAAAIVDTKLATISTADKVSLSALNIDGATDIGGPLEGGDLFIVDDGAGGTNRKASAFRMSQLAYSGVTGDIAIASGGTASISAGVIVNADVNSAAAIDFSKLASLTSANILLGNASNVATSTAVTGDVTISNAGVTAIASGVIVNADVNASAAIAGTKISPDFGSQNIVTTGTDTAASFNPTSSTVPTNGVYLPAANTVGVATNGTGRLFVDASGNIGIGTSTVGSYGIRILDFRGPSAGNGAILSVADGTNAGRGWLYSDGTTVQLRAVDATPLTFSTANTERLRITSAGLVGVGFSSPADIFNVKTDGNTGWELGSAGTGLGSRLLSYDRTAGIPKPAIVASETFSVQTSTTGGGLTPRLFINSSGSVGIGTSSPSAILDVAAGAGNVFAKFTSSNADPYLRLQNTSAAGKDWIIYSSGTGSAAAGSVRFYNNTDNVTPLTLDSSGRVGIGTASPASALHISGSGTQRIRITSTASGNALLTLDAPAGQQSYIEYGVSASNPLVFYDFNAATERARIDTSGRLLVGTSSSQCAVSTLKSVDTNNIGHFQTFAFYKGGLGQNPTNTNIIAVTMPNSTGISVTIMLNVRLTAYQNTGQGGERSATYCINLLRLSCNGGTASNAVQANVAQIGSDIATSVGAYSVGSLTVSVDAGSSSTGSVTAYIRISGTSTSGASDTRVYMSGYSMGSPNNQPTIAAA